MGRKIEEAMTYKENQVKVKRQSQLTQNSYIILAYSYSQSVDYNAIIFYHKRLFRGSHAIQIQPYNNNNSTCN